MNKKVRLGDLKKFQESINDAGFDFSVSADEIQQTLNEPPQRPDFPLGLMYTVSVFELLDMALGIGLEFTAVGGVVYRILRLLVTLYLYTWAWNRIHKSFKFIGAQKALLQGGRGVASVGIKKLALMSAVSHLPIPVIGAIIDIIPMDAIFVFLVHNDHSKFVQNIWASLNLLSKTKVYGKANVTRQKRGQIKIDSGSSTKSGGRMTSSQKLPSNNHESRKNKKSLKDA
jgi:hypothetical protein